MKIRDDQPVNQLVAKYVDEVGGFFELPKINIKVHLIQTKKEFDKIEGHKTEDWVVGFTKGNTVYVLDQDKFEKYSTHPKSDFEPVLKHEISHIYYRQLKPDGRPFWLNEGTACFVAGQKRGSIHSVPTLKILKSYHEKTGKNIYGYGEYIVSKIIKDYGKNKLFELIKFESPDALYDELMSSFKWLR